MRKQWRLRRVTQLAPGQLAGKQNISVNSLDWKVSSKLMVTTFMKGASQMKAGLTHLGMDTFMPS